MKKIIAFFLFATLIQSKAVYAQQSGVSSKQHNFSFQPIPMLIGILNAEYAYKIADHWTLGGSFAFGTLEVLDVEVEASSFSVKGRYYFQPALTMDSWYLVGSVGHSSVEAEIVDAGVTYTGEASGGFIGVGGGYHWFWETFNLYLGGFISAGEANKIELEDSLGNEYDDEPSNPAAVGIEFGLGWTF